MSDKRDRAIRVSERTRDTLRAIGMKNETYDDVIKRVIYQLNEAQKLVAELSAEVHNLRGGPEV